MERISVHQRLGPRRRSTASDADVPPRQAQRPAHPTVSSSHPPHRASPADAVGLLHNRLGPYRRASSSDRDGWQEVLGVSASQYHRQVQQVVANDLRGWCHRRRRLQDALRDRCLNCLLHTHRVATCRLPPRCLHCHEFRHLARDYKRPRSPVNDDNKCPQHAGSGSSSDVGAVGRRLRPVRASNSDARPADGGG